MFDNTYAQLFLEIEMFQTNVLVTIETHFMINKFFSFLKNRAIYEITWKNIVELGRPQMTIWRMCIVC
jgi:hypothetical protein